MKNKIWADETDAALDDAATRYLAERYRFEVRQLMTRDARRFNSTVWKDLADMGWLSVASSEAHGGLGLRVASICLLAEAAFGPCAQAHDVPAVLVEHQRRDDAQHQ